MWAGGKTKMLKHYLPHLPQSVDSYSEPFFGGGAMFIHVMRSGSPSRVFINDINADIMGIYRTIRDDLTGFLGRMDRLSSEYLPLDKEDRKRYFYDLRQENAYDYEKWSETDQSATLYFLMKTAFNGIWQINRNTNGRFGTPSGLLNQTTQVYDRDNVKDWHSLLSQGCVTLTSKDWAEVPVSDFTFYDPPYRDSFADYNNGFPDAELEKIIERVENGRGVWLTNRDGEDGFFENRRATLLKFPVTYTAGRRKRTEDGYEAKKAVEILLLN